jgi:hypothetical protein
MRIVFLMLNFKAQIYTFYSVHMGYGSWYNNWLWAGRQRGCSLSPGRVKSFLFSTSSRPNLGSYRIGIGNSFPRVKQHVSEAHCSPPISAEVKKMWFYTSTLPYAFLAQCLKS